jgi:hypothetical protein
VAHRQTKKSPYLVGSDWRCSRSSRRTRSPSCSCWTAARTVRPHRRNSSKLGRLPRYIGGNKSEQRRAARVRHIPVRVPLRLVRPPPESRAFPDSAPVLGDELLEGRVGRFGGCRAGAAAADGLEEQGADLREYALADLDVGQLDALAQDIHGQYQTAIVMICDANKGHLEMLQKEAYLHPKNKFYCLPAALV